MEIGHRLANLREKRGLSQAALAEKVGMSQSSIAMWETNKRRVPDDALIKLADFYNVSTDYLYGRNVPEWATNEDVLRIENIIEKDAPMTYAGENLDEDEIENIRQVVRATLWKRLKKKKESGADE